MLTELPQHIYEYKAHKHKFSRYKCTHLFILDTLATRFELFWDFTQH